MAGKSAYPVSADLSAFLTDAGITAPSAGTLTDAVMAGIQAFERATDRHFLAGSDIDGTVLGTAGNTLRSFVPPYETSGVLNFGPMGDLASVSLVQYVPTGQAATTYTLDTDYWLEPRNAPAYGQPYTSLHLQALYPWWPPIYYLTTPSGLENSIQITGKWGYSTTIPYDAWRGMLLASALHVIDQTRYSLAGGGLSWSGAGVSQSWGGSFYADVVGGWRSAYDGAVSVYRRLVI